MSQKRETASKKSRKKSAKAHAPTELTGVQRAARYVDDVRAGRVIACEYVKLACKRHRRDLRASKRANFEWRYDETRAERFIRFHESFPHVKDDFRGRARRHERFHLEDWQCFVYCSIFGWVHKKEAYRRFSEAYIEVPRKNGKTPGAAVVGLFGLTADGEYGADIFAAAGSTREQAGEVGSVFDTARAMALASPEFRRAFGVWVNKNSLVVQSANSSFKKIKGNPPDGPIPHMVLNDERHEQKTDRVIEWARTGAISRYQPLILSTTTAGTDTSVPCYQASLEAKEVLEGRRTNERLFCIVYTLDKKTDWKTEKALRMANPNYGVSINPATLKADQAQARQSASRQAVFKTKHLNIWLNAAQPWINMEHWDECFDAEMQIEDFCDEPCVESVDLASRTDTVSTARGFKRKLPTGKGGELEDHYFYFTRHYLNREKVRDEKHPHFADWADRGYLIETPGNVTDYGVVAADLAADAGAAIVRELVFDPYHAMPLVQLGLLPRDDWPQTVEIVELKQTEENMSPAMKELEAAIISRRFHHNGNPLLAWMIGNTRCRISQKENWYPVRENVERKIDGTVAIILGVNRLMQLDIEYIPSGKVEWV
jgi:phage terminase large subunit-like protein